METAEPAADALTEAAPDLAEGFAAFVAASRQLERSYAELKARAEAVDLQLASTNATLQRTLDEREAILAALPVGVLALDRAGSRAWSNPEAQRLDAALGARGLGLTDLDAGEHEIDGPGTAPLCLAVRRVDLPDGGVLVVVEDRSQVARLTREVDRLDRLAGLSELALGVAHEIKNPLNGVMGYADLLARKLGDEADADRLRCVTKISAGLAQVDRIVREMLAFARSPGASAKAPLDAIVAEAALCAGVSRRNITLGGDGSMRVPADALVRVLANLFRNSAENGDDTLRIMVTASLEAGDLRLRVQDNGPGIDPEIGDRIFEPFVSGKATGSGLGLALSARVLSFLGGTIDLAPGTKGGACFNLRLPCATPRGQSDD